MKKKFWKRLPVLGLTAVMTAGLCACGGGKDGDEPSSGGATSSSLAKEHVYRVQDIELPQLYSPGNGNIQVRATAEYDGRVSIVLQVYDYGNDYSEEDFRIVSMNTEGAEVSVTALEIPESEETGGNAAVTEEESAEAETEEAGAAETEDGEQAEDFDAADPDFGVGDVGTENSYTYSNYYPFVISDGGMIYAVKTNYFEDWSDPENYVSERTYSIFCWNADGTYAWEKTLDEFNGDDNGDTYTWFNNFFRGTDGKLYLLMSVSGEETTYQKIRLDEDGTLGEGEPLSEETNKVLQNQDQLITQTDGSLFIVYRDEEDWTKTYYTTYDICTDTLGESKDFPSTISYVYDYNVMTTGKNHDLIFTGSGGIYSWDEGKENGELMVDFVNSDIYVESVYGLAELTKDSFIAFYSESWDESMKAGVFTYVDPAEIQDKEVLVLAGRWIYSDMKKRVIEYNRSSEEYRIVLKDYSNYNSYEDYEAGLTKLNTDITTGGMPDILVADGLPIANYISKGLIADIDELIAKDEELSKTEFMQNAFDAYRVNGKLYYIVPDFEVYSFMAKEKWVGDKESWTMEDMQQALAAMPEGALAFGADTGRENFLNLVMCYCGNQFVDVSTGKCAFNTDDFISMLEYAKTLPTSEESAGGYDDEYWDDYWTNYQSQYREDRTLMMQVNFWRFDEMASSINGYFGEDVSFVGFPTESGNGSYIQCSNTYVLSAKSKHLDAAWDFMRYYLTDEYQKNSVSYFPVQKEAFYEKSKEALERPYWTYEDENGETVKEYYDLTIYINGEDVPYDPLTQEQLDQVIAFIESVHNPYYYNEEIMNIINEEAEAFFSGQKDAKAVAELIQSRVQLYVDENR